jgi:hypothetical protein
MTIPPRPSSDPLRPDRTDRTDRTDRIAAGRRLPLRLAGAAAGLLACLAVGCGGGSGEEEADGAGADGPTASDVADEAREAADTAGAYAERTLEEVRADMRGRLEAANERIESLEARAAELTGDAQAELQDTLEGLRRQRDQVADRLDALGDASGDAWRDVAEGAEQAWSELDAAVSRAVDRFGDDGGGDDEASSEGG